MGQASGGGDRSLPKGRGHDRATRGGAQPFGCRSCRSGLGGALLRLAQVGDRFGERGARQPEPLLGCPARRPHPVPLKRQARVAAVLTGQHRHDMNVIVRVPDRHPPDGVVLLPVRDSPVRPGCVFKRCLV